MISEVIMQEVGPCAYTAELMGCTLEAHHNREGEHAVVRLYKALKALQDKGVVSYINIQHLGGYDKARIEAYIRQTK